MPKNFYGVFGGPRAGIYTTWAACKTACVGVRGAKNQGFNTREEAALFVQNGQYAKKDDSDKVHRNTLADCMSWPPVQNLDTIPMSDLLQQLGLPSTARILNFYVDGSCQKEPKEVMSGVGIHCDEEESLCREFTSCKPYTSNRAEVQAIVHTLKLIDHYNLVDLGTIPKADSVTTKLTTKPTEADLARKSIHDNIDRKRKHDTPSTTTTYVPASLIRIFTDSQFAYNAITDWYPRLWKPYQMYDKAHYDLISKGHDLLLKLNKNRTRVIITNVPREMNDKADKKSKRGGLEFVPCPDIFAY